MLVSAACLAVMSDQRPVLGFLCLTFYLLPFTNDLVKRVLSLRGHLNQHFFTLFDFDRY